MERTDDFEHERPRLVALATRILGDHSEAEDIVQLAWLRLHRTDTDIESLPAWLTTVTTRLCLDRLRARTPVPLDEIHPHESGPDVADDVVLADTVGVALQAVIDRLTPGERVAFVLHDSFGFEFSTIASILDTTPAAARKLASRARGKVRTTGEDRSRGPSRFVPHTSGHRSTADGLAPRPTAGVEDARRADWAVVDAFMAAAREGDFAALLRLLAADAGVTADLAAVAVGTPERIDGRREIAEFFNGSAHAALAVYAGDRPGAAWYDRGTARVLFDFEIEGGVVRGITFRADESVLALVVRRRGAERHA